MINKRLNKKLCLFLLNFFFIFNSFTSFSQEKYPPAAFSWQNINGLSINEEGDFMVVETVVNGRSLLASSKKTNDTWSEPVLIQELNSFLGGMADLGGPFLCNKGTRLLFHANYSNSFGNKDIYSSDWNGERWSEPVNMGDRVNSIANEESPSITATNNKIYFTRDIPISDKKLRREFTQCKSIFFSERDFSGSWQKPEEFVEPINLGCDACPYISKDGKTLFFSSIRNDAENYQLYFTREIFEGLWLIPIRLHGIESQNDELDPNFVDGKVIFINEFIKKKIFTGIIHVQTLPSDMLPLPCLKIEGKISDLEGKPLNASIQVFNQFTSVQIGEFESNAKSGDYSLCLPVHAKYRFNVREKGYSFHSFEENISGFRDTFIMEPVIKLFNTINLKLSVFDSEIFRPLNSEIKIIDKENNSEMQVQVKLASEGMYQIELPIGKAYKILINSKGFKPGEMDFNIMDDIVYNLFERQMALEPQKKEFEINLSDIDSKENLTGEIEIKNLSRDETIIVSAADIKDGKASVLLRDGDKYEFNIKGPKGYSFYNNTIDLKSETEKKSLDVELKSLKAQTSITLNNITFEKNSADLNAISFAELDRVVSLIKDNTELMIEISAHTDDIGTSQYNEKLSERRAGSVVKYLIDKGVPVERLVAKGYGEDKPMVPNDSDENRALNRRVEFKIIGFVKP